MSNSSNYGRLPTGEYDEEDRSTTLKKQLKKQDENLDILGSSVERLGELSLNISREIESQNDMLSRIEEDVERAQNNVDSLIGKTKELVKKSG